MRTADEMIKELDSALLFSDVKKLMKQYAKEAIEECAERAKILWGEPIYIEEERDNIYPVEGVDKESILSLIKELK